MTKSKPISELFDFFSDQMSNASFKAALITAEISARITKERIDRKMTQKEFSAFLGVSQPMVSKWEAGDYNFTISAVSEIFEKLGLDYDFEIRDNAIEEVTVEYTPAPAQKLPSIVDLKHYKELSVIA